MASRSRQCISSAATSAVLLGVMHQQVIISSISVAVLVGYRAMAAYQDSTWPHPRTYNTYIRCRMRAPRAWTPPCAAQTHIYVSLRASRVQREHIYVFLL